MVHAGGCPCCSLELTTQQAQHCPSGVRHVSVLDDVPLLLVRLQLWTVHQQYKHGNHNCRDYLCCYHWKVPADNASMCWQVRCGVYV